MMVEAGSWTLRRWDFKLPCPWMHTRLSWPGHCRYTADCCCMIAAEYWDIIPRNCLLYMKLIVSSISVDCSNTVGPRDVVEIGNKKLSCERNYKL